MTLTARAWLSLILLAQLMALLVFASAGTLRYWQAWLYLAVFFAAATFVTRDLMRRDPALLERRMHGGPTAEKEPAQRIIMVFASLGFISLLVVPGLDHRFGWSSMPVLVVAAGDVLTAVGFFLVSRVYRENPFLFATIEVAKDQRVITTGPYAVVRHPMYAFSSVYLFGTPLALGSWWGLLGLALMLPFLIWRLLDEEDLLARRLPGYREYQQRVHHRLVPGIW
ncbi:MAG TPA: isoprenylcysteine carboxylmethyltransferase family protein [Myxococcota bacterium]|nr:isoprenylcysteine carboxylmethyltransferase family protein [Myxococcota bacterium]